MPARTPYHDRPRNPRQHRLQLQRCQEFLATCKEKTPASEPEPPVDLTRFETRRLLKRLEATLNEISYAQVEIDRLRSLLLASQEESSRNVQERGRLSSKLRQAIAANSLLSQKYAEACASLPLKIGSRSVCRTGTSDCRRPHDD